VTRKYICILWQCTDRVQFLLSTALLQLPICRISELWLGLEWIMTTSKPVKTAFCFLGGVGFHYQDLVAWKWNDCFRVGNGQLQPTCVNFLCAELPYNFQDDNWEVLTTTKPGRRVMKPQIYTTILRKRTLGSFINASQMLRRKSMWWKHTASHTTDSYFGANW
jgi:hypothetical protein